MRTQGSLLAGRYRVLTRLGSGGMASVLLCRDERLGRPVAVKRLHADSPGEIEQRFAREAKLGASLNHPNLVAVYDTATDDEGVLIVMEYVEGETLSQALLRGPLDAARVADLASELGDALAHAHAHGVVHRDVKPANVLLRDDGVTKLADLGIATAADQTRITRSGIVLGTAAYMAPEQLDGREAGPPVDVYALAAVCFEALTGRRARAGRTPMEIARSIAVEPPPDLREVLPGAPAAAAEVLRDALALDPVDRPSAAQLGSRLGRALQRWDEPTVAVAPTGPRRLDKAPPRRREPAPPSRPWLAVALVSALVAVAAATAAVLASGGGDDQPPPTREAERRPADRDRAASESEQPREPAPAPAQPAPEPPAPASGSELNAQGFALMQAGRYEEAVPLLQEAVASWPEDSRDIEYAYALFNLGKSLNRSGDPEAAIPYLEKRLTFDDQVKTVQKELDKAKRAAERA